jgi:hypothetical protein
MLRHTLLAAATALFAAPALGQAAPVDVELEGVINSYTHATRTMVVMGMAVEITDATVLQSPTTTRAETGRGIDQWMRQSALPGRGSWGFIGGTGIVIGQWDPARNRIVATEVTMEPSENVSIGVITSSWCSTPNCDATTDYLRGNTNAAGQPGPAMLPIRDERLAAGPVRDETGFALNLTGANLNGLAYAAEGYLGSSPVTVRTPTGGTASEKAFHYFIFDLVNPAPQLFLNKGSRELSVLRTDCREGERFEMTGHVHSRVAANGAISDTVLPNSGVVEIVYTQANGTVVRRNATAVRLAGNSPIARFRVRFDVPAACPATVTARWVTQANQANPTIHAQQTGVAVEIRDDGAGDD